MEELNKILEDESNNDKLLIKELSVYVKNHYKNNLPINKKFITDVTSIILKNSQIDFEGIFCDDEAENIAGWLDDEKVFLFNVQKMLNTSKEINKEWFKSKIPKKIMDYYYTIDTIIHESTHARQYHIIDNKVKEIYTSGDRLIYDNYFTYLMNHDLVLVERYANLRASMMTYQVLSYIFPEEKIKDLRMLGFDYLFTGYEVDFPEEQKPVKRKVGLFDNATITSAVDNYNYLLEQNSLERVNFVPNENMTLYERFYLGLPIDNKDFNALFELFEKLDEKEGSVLKLINNYKKKGE